MDNSKKIEIRKYMILLCLVTFCVTIVNYKGWVRSYNTTMFALSYEYGFTSRSFLGTIYHGIDWLLPVDMMQYNCAVVFAAVVTGIFYIFLMYFAYKCLCLVDGKKLKYVEYALLLLLICTTATFTYAYNYLRVDIFMIWTSLIAVLCLFSEKLEWLSIPLSAIGVMFHQGFVLMYFNIILIIQFYKLMTHKEKRLKYGIIFASSFILGSAMFLWFELFSRTNGTQIFERVLTDATNVSKDGVFHSTLLFHEVLGIDVSGAETSFVYMNHVQFIIFALCCLPLIIYIVWFFGRLIKKGEDIFAKLKYIAALIGSLTIMPDMLFKVDYGRWVMAVAAYYIVITIALGALGDKLVLDQMEKDFDLLKEKPWIIILCLMPIVLTPFMDVDIDMFTKNLQRWFQAKSLIFY